IAIRNPRINPATLAGAARSRRIGIASCTSALLQSARSRLATNGNPRRGAPLARGTTDAHPGMVLGAIIVSVLLAMAVYGLWMAGQLGVGPRWRRPPRTAT